MHRLNSYVCLSLLALGASASDVASAGPFSDEFARCLVTASTDQDQTVLAQWMFAALSSHPDVAGYASVTAEQLENANKAFADTFNRLVTVDCAEEGRSAVQYEGPVALQQAFQVFGQVAGQALFAHPTVGATTASFERHLNMAEIEEALGMAE